MTIAKIEVRNTLPSAMVSHAICFFYFFQPQPTVSHDTKLLAFLFLCGGEFRSGAKLRLMLGARGSQFVWLKQDKIEVLSLMKDQLVSWRILFITRELTETIALLARPIWHNHGIKPSKSMLNHVMFGHNWHGETTCTFMAEKRHISLRRLSPQQPLHSIFFHENYHQRASVERAGEERKKSLLKNAWEKEGTKIDCAALKKKAEGWGE